MAKNICVSCGSEGKLITKEGKKFCNEKCYKKFKSQKVCQFCG